MASAIATAVQQPANGEGARPLRVAWRLTLLLFAAFSLSYFLTSAGFDASEGVDAYELAQHFVKTGELGIANPRGPTFATGPDGRKYDPHEFGNPLAMLPWVALGNALSATFGSILPLDRADRLTSFLVCVNAVLAMAAVAAGLFWILVYPLGMGTRTALRCAVAFGFGTMVFQYSKNLWDGVLLSALLMFALAFAWSYSRAPRMGLVLATGTALGLAFITRIPAALFVPALAVYLTYAVWQRKRSAAAVAQVLAVLGLPLVAALFWQGWYNHLRTGHALLPPVLLGESANHVTLRGGNLFIGLAGILVSPGKSLFFYSPPLLFAIMGYRKFLARHRAEALCLAGFLVPYFLLHCAGQHWTGDWGWGPRYHLPLLGPLFVAAAFWLAQAGPRGRRAWLAVLLWGVTIQSAAVWNDWQYRFTTITRAGHSTYEMIWNPRYTLWVDAVANVGRNVERMAGRRDWDVVPGAHPIHVRAANTVNFWWVNVPLGGGNRAFLLAVVVALLVTVLFLWRRLFDLCDALGAMRAAFAAPGAQVPVASIDS